MLFPTIASSIFAIALGWAIWWTWKQRQVAREQAEFARQQAQNNAELAVLGERVKAVAHDVDNLFAILLSNLSSAPGLSADELREMVGDVERATSSASRMIRAMRNAQVGPNGERSIEPIVQLVVGLLQRGDVPIDVEFRGTMTYRGSEEDALRVVQNLAVNAAREARRIPGGRLSIVVDERRFQITNPVKDCAAIHSQDIYRRGLSNAGSTGLGLDIARERASALGWSLDHALNGDRITFTVQSQDYASN